MSPDSADLDQNSAGHFEWKEGVLVSGISPGSSSDLTVLRHQMLSSTIANVDMSSLLTKEFENHSQ